MDLAAFPVAVFGVFLGALALGWLLASRVQVVSRVKVELRVGALPPDGAKLISGPLRSTTAASMARLALLGYTRQVIAVKIRNVGRAPVTVMRWSLVDHLGNSLTPDTDSIGQPLPFQLQVGESQIWAVDAEAVRVMANATAVTLFSLSSSLQMFGRVELAGGRVVDTKARLQLHNRRLRAVGW
jgi:hypothetical protein